MLIFRFGWAKPVPINSRYYKHPKRDLIIVSVAGPITNLVLAFIGCLLERIAETALKGISFQSGSFAYTFFSFLLTFLYLFTILNVSFCIFNLLPIPPLDGSRLLTVLLPLKWQMKFIQYERYIAIGLIVLLWLGLLSRPLQFLVTKTMYGMNWIISLLPFL